MPKFTLFTLIFVATILSTTPLFAINVVALAVAIPPSALGDAHSYSLSPRFSPVTDGASGNGHISHVVVKSIIVVLLISICFVLALQWLRLWRPAQRTASHVRLPSRPTSLYSNRPLRNYYGNGSRAASVISGSTLFTVRDVEFLGTNPVSILAVPAPARVRPPSTSDIELPCRAAL
jgi:hypothetical protein